jgi:hypothetical protein
MKSSSQEHTGGKARSASKKKRNGRNLPYKVGQANTHYQRGRMMKKVSLALISVAVLLVQSASAQLLFTTTNDFSGWSAGGGFTNVAPTTGMDSDGGIINGLGNQAATGSNGTGGALSFREAGIICSLTAMCNGSHRSKRSVLRTAG